MEQKAMIIGEETVRRYLSAEDVIDICEKTWRWYGQGKVVMPNKITTDMSELPEVRQFITEDEISESFIGHGSGIHNGKYRIYDYLTGNHTDKEKIEFLKNEYGTGGHSHALSGATHSGEDHDSRGIRLKKNGCADVEMSWTNVLKRLNELIRDYEEITQGVFQIVRGGDSNGERSACPAVSVADEQTDPRGTEAEKADFGAAGKLRPGLCF